MDICFGATPLGLRQNQELSEELALVQRCRRNDTEAFGRVIDAYQHRVFGFVRRMVHNDEDAADIAQEVFIRAFQSISRFDGRSSMKTWLFQIAHNLCIDRSRRLDRNPQEARIDSNPDEERVGFDLPDTRWNPETMILVVEFREVIEQGMECMSDKLRSVLLLHDREDLAYEEISQALDIPIGTVKSRLFLARAFMHERIQAYLAQEAQAYE
jgi:RNA polymerase sigma-70 factor (ECF subfamily)